MFKKTQKWSAIILFGFSIFVAGYILAITMIASTQEQYAKAIWYAICSLGWLYWIYIAYCWYSKNK